MSNSGSIYRYLSIIKKLEKQPYASFEEIDEYLMKDIDKITERNERINIGFSKRTFQRTLKEIREIFDIEIIYSRKENGYFLKSDIDKNSQFQRVLDEFNIYTTMKVTKGIDPHIQYEERKPLGADNLYEIMHAIKNKLILKFKYQKYWEDDKEDRKVEPYLIKEFKHRWYLIAKDHKDNLIKSFGLDRISLLDTTNEGYKNSETRTIKEKYKHCFGIYNLENNAPQEVVISMNAKNGKYLKSLPLHHSQKVILDTAEECKITLNIFLTYDFIQELVSLGSEVKVVSPDILVTMIKDAHQKALANYL